MDLLREVEEKIAYQLVRPIAEGGMGCVYEALQIGADGFQKRVAIKVIREEYSSVRAFRQNFLGEARLVADLIHNCIVQSYHLGEIEGQYYMVMEYVNGVNLEEFLLQHRATGNDIPTDLACFIISRVCRGLAYAHAKTDLDGNPLGIVHRDVNPRNIMVSFEGDVKLTDFGIAKALNLMYNEEGKVIAGKDEYLSPEQAERQVTDARADLFSCGVVLSEMICGRNLFEVPESPEQTRANIVAMALPDWRRYRDPLDEEVSEILDRALERSRERRYQSAEAMMKALEMCIYGRGYGPTAEKLARYLSALFANGKAYADDLPRSTQTFGFGSRRRL
ncbi:MAG: serine/threonine protein kinase [Verrucomicrobiota bacterium]